MTRDRNPDGRTKVTTTGVHLRKDDPASWSQATPIELVDDALVVVTQAYCHNGHRLVTTANPTFGGFPGVRVQVTTDQRTEDVVLSPIHGHQQRQGGDGIAEGARCRVACPKCSEEFPEYAPCVCGAGQLRSIFLTPDASESHVVAVCENWGCHKSRILDEFEILSEYVDAELAEAS